MYTKVDDDPAQRLADRILADQVERKPGLTSAERYASVVAQLRRGDSEFCHQVLDLIGEPYINEEFEE